jgi:hypothetical protein
MKFLLQTFYIFLVLFMILYIGISVYCGNWNPVCWNINIRTSFLGYSLLTLFIAFAIRFFTYLINEYE